MRCASSVTLSVFVFAFGVAVISLLELRRMFLVYLFIHYHFFLD